MSTMIVITGGSASGKSEQAEGILCRYAAGERLYLATMEPFGREAEMRIARHRALRQGKGFALEERPCDLAGLTLPRHYAGILLEDVGNLLANEMYSPAGAGTSAERAVIEGVLHLREQCDTLVVVTDEVFSDGLPYDDETRRYIELLGNINCALAQQADAYAESVCGILVPKKGGEWL